MNEQNATEFLNTMFTFMGQSIATIPKPTLTLWKNELMLRPDEVVKLAFEVYKKSGDRAVNFAKFLQLAEPIWIDYNASARRKNKNDYATGTKKATEQTREKKGDFQKWVALNKKILSSWVIEREKGEEPYLTTVQGRQEYYELFLEYPDPVKCGLREGVEVG